MQSPEMPQHFEIIFAIFFLSAVWNNKKRLSKEQDASTHIKDEITSIHFIYMKN